MPLASQIAVTPLRIAGLSPANWSNGDGGPATNALLSPSAFAWDRAGNLLIADSRNQSIRRMTPDGLISTAVNQAGAGVASIAVDSHGNVYVSAFPNWNVGTQLFEFSPTGAKTQIPNPAASSYVAPAIAIDAADNLYITDENGGFVWKRSPSGSVAVIAGNGGPSGPATQGGPALQVALYTPYALTFDSSSNLLIVDGYGILRLNPDGNLVRLFGNVGSSPARIAPAADGSIYFIEGSTFIWRWSQAGGVAVFAGTDQSGFSDGCALSGGKRVARYASFNPSDIAIDSAGRIYIADNFFSSSDPGHFYSNSAGRVRRIDPDGSVRTVAGTGSMPRESAPGGPALGSIFHNPEALAVDGAGNVFFAESAAGHVHEITAAGQFLTVAGTASPPAGEDPACYPAGEDVLSSPRGIAVDSAGNLFVSDTGNNRILRRSPDGVISTIAGTGSSGQTGDGGPAMQAEISAPTAISVRPSSGRGLKMRSAIKRQSDIADGDIYFVSDGKVRSISTGGIIQSPQMPQGISWLAAGFDARLVLSGYQLYKETREGSFYPLRSGVGEFAADPEGAIYIPANPLLRISPNCGSTALTFPSGLISQALQGLASDPAGSIYQAADNSVWRIPAIARPAADTPSVYLNNLSVFNAASNLTALEPPASDCITYHDCEPYAVNDSIAGNEILSITGGCLGPLQPSRTPADSGQLPVIWQGTKVLFNGEAAPLISVQGTEILAIAPQDVASRPTVTITVENQGGAANVSVSAGAAAPGIFVLSGTQAAAINEDGTPNGSEHPAPAGSIVSLFLTGTGATVPPTVDGVIPSPPLPRLALPVTVTVGGVAAEVVYSGSASGQPGVAQVNIRVPVIAASGAAPVQVAVGGYSRNQAVTLAVK